jgi:hypothetical protein
VQKSLNGRSPNVMSAVSGMRRIDCVRMVEDDRPRFYVVGVGHRFPVEREITPTVALALLDQVPCRYEWRPQHARRRAGKAV